MDKSNTKGQIRNRHAKLQPLVNRIAGFQIPNSASNYHRTNLYYDHSIDSYAHQLQNDFGNLVLANTNNMETKVIKKPVDVEFRNSEMPMVPFGQSVLSPATNAEMARKQKKHKHRTKEKLYRTSFLDLRAELVDILNCILYILWSPIVFFARLFLTFPTSSTSVLYNIVNLFALQCTNINPEKKPLKLEEKKLEILNNFTANSQEEKRILDFNELASKPSSNVNPKGCFHSAGVKHNVTNAQAQTDDGKSRRELQSLRKKFNLSLEMVNEMCGNLGIDGGNYFQYSSCHQDISSVELSSDCLSDKYSSRFIDYKDGRKRALRQYQKSVSVAGKKISHSTLRNSSFKGSNTIVNSKRSHVHLKNSSRKNERRILIEIPDLSDASGLSDKQIGRIDPKNQLYMYDKRKDSKLELVDRDSSRTGTEDKFSGHKKISATLVTKFRKKRAKMSRPHSPFTPLPLRPTLQKKPSSEDEYQSEEITKKCDSNLINDSKSSFAQIHKLQFTVEPHLQIPTKLETYMNIDKDLFQKKELENSTIVPISLNQCNTEKLICQYDAECSSFQCKSHFRTIKNEPIVARSLKTVSDLNKALPRDECKEYIKTTESPSLNRINKDLLQCEKLNQGFEAEKRTNGLGDVSRASNNEKSKIGEFTKPIDAKSKWIEMKKKFYSKDYTVMKEEPEKLKAANLSSIKSISKLPPQNIFQYNMQVGRARQMGEEPPLAADIFLERKTTAPCLKALGNSAPGTNLRRNEQQCSKSLVPKSRCLSQTQSLSQWPIGPSNFSGTKTYCSLQQELKPKPKPRAKGELNQCKVQGDGKTSGMGIAQISQRAATRTNSSVSSSDVRHNRIFPLDWPSQAKKLPMKNANSVDDYAEKIDSLIAFCQSPPSAVPRKSNDKEYKQVNRADCKFFDEAAAGDSS